MDTLWLLELERLRYEDRLRAAERRRRLWQDPKFRKLHWLIQSLIIILG